LGGVETVCPKHKRNITAQLEGVLRQGGPDTCYVLDIVGISLLLFLVFHNGGSPHGMMPSPGIWKIVGRISGWTLVASIVLSAFGKGRWRLFIPAWAAAYTFVVYAVFMLDRD